MRKSRTARAKQLLTLSTEGARDRQVREGTEALAFGVIFTGAGKETVAEIECRLFAREKEAKLERKVSAVTSFVFGALEIGGGIALEIAAEDHGLNWLGRGLMAGGVGAGILGIGTLAIRSEEERLADLWRTDRASPSPVSSLRIVPRIGFGSAGIAGIF